MVLVPKSWLINIYCVIVIIIIIKAASSVEQALAFHAFWGPHRSNDAALQLRDRRS